MKHRTTDSSAFSDAETPWQSCIAVCQKCAAKLNAMDGEKSQLRVALKQLIAERDIKSQVRAIDASCFDLCPEERITIMHFSPGGVRAINAAANVTAPEILEELGI